MSDKTKIEWTDATWNPVTGCSVVSPGCTNCYAMLLAGTRLRHHPSRQGLTDESRAGPVWNGQVRLNEAALADPLRWKRPRRIFVCAHGDLFHEAVPDEWIDRVFAVMALSPQHAFQVLTKRAERMQRYVVSVVSGERSVWMAGREFVPGSATIARLVTDLGWSRFGHAPRKPLPNVWLGVSAEDQARADERIPVLLDTPAAKRFVSLEPLLGAVDLTRIPSPVVTPEDEGYWHSALESGDIHNREGYVDVLDGRTIIDAVDGPMMDALDWVIVGGESGPGARPMHPDWARQIRDDCAAAGVPFFFKQWGEWAPGESCGPSRSLVGADLFDDGWSRVEFTRSAYEGLHVDDEPAVWRVGKRAADRLLDGVTHDAMPEGA